jgi:hypothetical protein
MATPESLASSALQITNIGTWDLAMVNMSSQAVIVRREEVLMGVPRLHVISAARALESVRRTDRKSKSNQIIGGLSFLDIIVPGLMGGGLIQASVKAVASAALGTAVLHHYTDLLKSEQPDLSAFTANELPEEVSLAPYGQSGYGATYTVYASKMKGADTLGPVLIGAPPPPQQLTPAPAAHPEASTIMDRIPAASTIVNRIPWIYAEMVGL